MTVLGDHIEHTGYHHTEETVGQGAGVAEGAS